MKILTTSLLSHSIFCVAVAVSGFQLILVFLPENEEIPPGIKQSGNAKIVFNDADYMRKVSAACSLGSPLNTTSDSLTRPFFPIEHLTLRSLSYSI